MPRTPVEIDTTPFSAVMAEAVVAFGRDLGYGTQMARRAVVILDKQEVHSARSFVRDASADARGTCALGPALPCGSELPCGVGPDCRNAHPVLLSITENQPLGPGRGGKITERPQCRPDGTTSSYNVESVVYAVRDLLRHGSGPRRPAPACETAGAGGAGASGSAGTPGLLSENG